MVKPTQPKGIKPKAEITEEVSVPTPTNTGGAGNTFLSSGVNLLIINTVITVVICLLFMVGNYFTVNSIVNSNFKNFSALIGTQGDEGGEDIERPERGIILDLGEFILNLSDPSAKRYLKVNVALELSRSELDPDLSVKPQKSGGHGAAAEDPLAAIEKEMNQYKPAIRDAIISILSSKSAEELSSLAGKDLAKEQIKDAINPIFAGEREVIRVSFGAFIIQ
ncbi:MAG: flagellar basal body-associated FliL family protein [Candidatus Gastranaerophilales bacterium]|nr:flagellar basal body-associated FliL family protein [Candidatus Gastranaerophilales bacterium]